MWKAEVATVWILDMSLKLQEAININAIPFEGHIVEGFSTKSLVHI